jgi:tetratricopeptide (TPR) repeat protein
MLSLSMLLNRQHVALNRIETPTNNNGVTVSKLALDCIKKSFKIAYDLQDADQLIQNYIDFGNVYFYSGGLHSNKAISYWKKAYYIFVNNKSKVAGWECGVCYHMAIVATLEHDYEAAIEMIERVNFAYKKDLSIAYYYSKSEILRSIIMLMQKKSFEDVLLVINNVENLCQLTENVGPLTICSYIKAKTYELLKQDYETASIFYHKALEQYITLCETSLEEEKASIYLIDISIALRRLNVTINDEIISRVKTLQLKRELYYILTIEDDKRTILKNGYLEKSPFYNISQTIVYPCP